ncbi:MAG: transcriptional repressor [Spirochaetes bacterium]|nr:transcriptional repressor [Spirochaetota bacterium]
MTDELRIFRNFIKKNNIKNSRSREKILEIFLNTEKHISIYELHDLVKRQYPEIGLATIYRAMNIICRSDLAETINIGDGVKRFEHKYGHRHHDHLICIKCGKIIEMHNDDIEEIQKKMCKKFDFKMTDHKLQIFGYCKNCLD